VTPRHPFAVAVVTLVAKAYGLDADILWTTSRMPTVNEARHFAWWKVQQVLGWSNVELGICMGVDNTTVLVAMRKTAVLVRDGTGTPSLRHAVQVLEKLSISDALGLSEPKERPPSLVLSPSESGSPSEVLSASFSASDSGSKEPVSKPARGTRNRPRTAAPDTLLPNDKHRQIATDKGVDLAVEVERFLSFHRAKGNLMASWNSALTTWLLSPYVKTTVHGGRPPPGANFNRLKALAEQAEREEKRNAAQ
jgi:hypothetical protein